LDFTHSSVTVFLPCVVSHNTIAHHSKQDGITMLSKKEQTRKKKMRDEKRLEKKDMERYKQWIKNTHPTCQINLCGDGSETVEAHHVLFGCWGADKDDRFLVASCRACHEWAHAHKKHSQALLLHVARENWKQYGGADDD